MAGDKDNRISPPDREPLSSERAFVVQLRGKGGRFAGRVEHMASGETLQFDSPEELLAFLQGRPKRGRPA